MKITILPRLSAPMLVVAWLLATAERLPAPISEVESPTPTPEPSASATSPIEPQPVKQGLFAGTWAGRAMASGKMTPEEIVIDETDTMIWRENGMQRGVEKAQRNGRTLQAIFSITGIPVVWSLTPEPDGKTALVKEKALGNEQAAVFHRVAE